MTVKQKFRQSKYRPTNYVFLAALVWVGIASCSHSTVPKKPNDLPSPDREGSSLDSNEKNELRVELSSSKVSNGSVLRIELKGAPQDTTAVTAKFEAEAVPFFLDEKSARWIGFLPVSFYQKPGQFSLPVEIRSRSRVKPILLTSAIEIIEGVYPSEVLKVAQKHVTPNKKDLIRIRKESAELHAIYQQSTPTKLWNGEFILPVDSMVTSPYGVKRLYNGQLKNFHQGLDFRAPTGTPIVAPGDGKVVLAKDLFYTGNTVIIDHGYSIYTVYAHMSELRVRSGRKVAAKDLLGLSGSTGRATGPHLHWGAVIRSVKINPVDLMRVLR